MSRNVLPLPAQNKEYNVGYLTVRRNADGSEEVSLSVEQGRRLICTPGDCTVSISFDGRPPLTFQGASPKDWGSTRIVFEDPKTFIQCPASQEDDRELPRSLQRTSHLQLRSGLSVEVSGAGKASERLNELPLRGRSRRRHDRLQSAKSGPPWPARNGAIVSVCALTEAGEQSGTSGHTTLVTNSRMARSHLSTTAAVLLYTS